VSLDVVALNTVAYAIPINAALAVATQIADGNS
jgi:hypothetical protein